MTGTFHRDDHLARAIGTEEPFDLIIIGGGASGVGTAVDAASRGLSVLLLEGSDFGKGTSSRSTKLIHGGVRYLQQGNIGLVRESLRERALLLNNAPHLVHPLEFVLPCRSQFEVAFYWFGMKLYDCLSSSRQFPSSKRLKHAPILERLPELEPTSFVAGIAYHDGQFDDSRLLINLVQTAAEQGAVMLNGAKVVELIKPERGAIEGVCFLDVETDKVHRVRGRCVINTTGPFCDDIRRLDRSDVEPLVTSSQGIHLVLPGAFFPGSTALIVPKTKDGRVMFIIPWHQHVLLGTTDTPIPRALEEPTPLNDEIDFLLRTAEVYMHRKPTLQDCLSVFAGIRPLVKQRKNVATSALSRDHTIEVSSSKLVTMTGGKWTTYRKMGADCVDRAMAILQCSPRTSATHQLPVHGSVRYNLANQNSMSNHESKWHDVYGTDLVEIEQMIQGDASLGERIHPSLPIRRAEVLWAVRHEWARTVEDVLARRTRALFLNAAVAREMAPEVAHCMAQELGRDSVWENKQRAAFEKSAMCYVPHRK